MSSNPTPEAEMTQVVTDTLASQLLFGNTNDKAGILARAVVRALKTNPGITDWLIHGGAVYRVEEVRDGWPDDGRHFWELVTTEEDEDETRKD